MYFPWVIADSFECDGFSHCGQIKKLDCNLKVPLNGLKGVAVNKDEKGVEIWRPLWHQPWRCRVWSLPSWFSAFLCELQLSDWMNLRRVLELWTFNIVESAIDYGGFGSWTKCIFYYAMGRYGPQRLLCLNKPMGAREWNVMVCICLAQGVVLFGGIALLK